MHKLPFEVVCIKDVECGLIKIGNQYTVYKVQECKCEAFMYDIGILFDGVLDEVECKCGRLVPAKERQTWWDSSLFRKINPYQSSVSRSLAERAVESIGDGQDLKPVEVKEVLQ